MVLTYHYSRRVPSNVQMIGSLHLDGGLFGGQKFATYTIEADSAMFADLLAEADAWWQRYIVADMPPEPSTEDDARRLWKSHVAGP